MEAKSCEIDKAPVIGAGQAVPGAVELRRLSQPLLQGKADFGSRLLLSALILHSAALLAWPTAVNGNVEVAFPLLVRGEMQVKLQATFGHPCRLGGRDEG